MNYRSTLYAYKKVEYIKMSTPHEKFRLTKNKKETNFKQQKPYFEDT